MAEPITTAELKAHLRISHNTQDDYLATLIATAREEVERDTWRGLVAATKTFARRGFPGCYPFRSARSIGRPIEIPSPPLRSVTSITYRDEAGNSVELSSSLYVVDTIHEPGTIEPAPNTTWPGTQDHPAAVVIVCETGYVNAAAVPVSLKHAVKLIAAELFQATAPMALSMSGGGTGTLRTTLDRLLEKWRVRCAGILDCV